MATDDEKSAALEILLKDSLHALESLENFQQLEDEERRQEESEEDASDSEGAEEPVKPARRKRDEAKSEDQAAAPRKQRVPLEKADPADDGSLINRLTGYTSSAYRLARRTTGTSMKVGKALIGSQDQLRMMLSAGESLRDLREVAGMTVSDLSDALNLKDKSLLEAVEDGTATMSFELILRLAAVFARNDPIPFILKYTRTYSPDTWRVLNDWGVGRLPLHFEREREFMNIYRGHDEARYLSDEGFKRVLEYTRASFEMSLHFVAEEEKRLNEALDELEEERQAALKEGRAPKVPKRERRHKNRKGNGEEKKDSKSQSNPRKSRKKSS